MRIPVEIAAIIGAAEFERVDIGRTRATVHKVVRDGQPTLFLKSGRVTPCDDLADEAKRLGWLQGRLRVPAVLSYVSGDEYQYLLTTGLPGVHGVDAGRQTPEEVVRGVAQALAELHSTSVLECPFDETRRVRTQRARARLQNGCVDESDFDEERLGMTGEQLWRQLDGYVVFEERLVLTHGDPCLPNILFDGGRVAGFVDCGRAGVADAYQDLALVSRSIASNLGPEWVPSFFDAYGLRQVDGRKLGFYRLLDEFF
jgi:aminoglycoside 3'-phosphotransferase II